MYVGGVVPRVIQWAETLSTCKQEPYKLDVTKVADGDMIQEDLDSVEWSQKCL